MKKNWIIILIIVAIIIGVIIGALVYNKETNTENNIIQNEIEEISEKTTNVSIQNKEELGEIEEIETNSNEEKISPNCLLTLKRYYKECGHLLNEYISIPQNLVNKTQKELEDQYPNWKIEKYSSTQITLYNEFESSCGQHFVLRSDNGKIVIYKINEDDIEELYQKTEIAIDYLTETDKIEIENGIRVNGIEELNQLIEDFE